MGTKLALTDMALILAYLENFETEKNVPAMLERI